MAEPTPGRRGPQTRGARTRERILDAVLEITALDGPRAVTYRSVGERAGVSQGVMTYHFKSRRELLSQAFQLHQRRIREAALALPLDESRTLSPRRRARVVFAFLKNMVVDERARYLAEFELTLELARDPELRAEIGNTTDVTRQLARDLLERSGSTAPRPDAVLMSAVMEGLTLEWMARPDDPAFEREVRRAVTRLVELFLP